MNVLWDVHTRFPIRNPAGDPARYTVRIYPIGFAVL